MRVLLLSPILFHSGGNPKNIHRPPLSLAYLAARLLEDGHEVKIIDFYSLELWQKKAKLIESFHPDLVGITAKTTAFVEAAELIKISKHLGFFTVIGGPQPTATPETVMKSTPVDALFIGEAEGSFAEYANNKAAKINDLNMDGVVQRDKGKVYWPVHRFPQIVPIDELPNPARYLLDNVYTPYIDCNQGKIDAEAMIASRGCLGTCTFCHIKGRVGWIGRNVTLVVDEMEELLKTTGKKGIYFNDLCLAGSKEWAILLCKEIIKRKLKVFWTCETRVDNLDKELVAFMAKAGCVRLSFGVETLNDTILRNINKRTTVKQIERAVANANKVGITPYLQMILGLPGETYRTIKNTVNLLDQWIEKYNVYVAGFGPLWLYPGTPLFRQYGDPTHNWLKTVSPETIFPTVPLYTPPGLERKEVLKLCKELTEKYRKIIAKKHPIYYKSITDYQKI